MTICMTPLAKARRGKSFGRQAISQFLTAPGELALRISGPGQSGRLVRIHSSKCTVGSAKGCTLRLVARGIAGIECWILRGSGGAFIRRFGGAAQLNGACFDEAPLAAGDRLSIGPVEIVIEECGTEECAAIAVADEPAPGLPAGLSGHTLELEARLAGTLEHIRRLEAESRQGFESSITAADRADQLSDALANANEQLQEVVDELSGAQATIEQQSRDLNAAQGTIHRQAAELAAAGERCEEHAHHQQTAEAELSELNAKITSSQETIDRLSSELADERAKAAATLSAADQTTAEALAKIETDLAEARKEREALSNELQQAKETLSTERAQRHDEQTSAAQLREQHDSELNSLREQFEASLAAAHSEREALIGDLRLAHEALTIERAHRQDDQVAATQLREQLAAKSAEIAAILEQQSSNEASAAILWDLRQQIEQLQSQIEAAQQQAATAEAELATLRQNQQQQIELQTQIEAVTSELTAKNGELEEARQAVATLTSQLASAGEIGEQKSAIEAQQTELAYRENVLAETMRSLESKQAALAAECEQLAHAKQKLADKEQQLNEAALQIDQAQQALQTQAAQSGEADEHAKELESRTAEIATRLSELDRLLEQLVDDRASLGDREQDVYRREQDFETRLSDLNRQAEQFQALREQLDQREAHLQEREAAAANRVSEMSLRQTSVDVMQTTCRDSSQLSIDSGLKPSDNCGDQLHQTIVTSPEPRGNTNQTCDSAEISALGELAGADAWRDNVESQHVESQQDESPRPAMTEPTPAPPRFVAATEDISPPRPSHVPRSMQPPMAGDEEESIESYMERLMQRVRGDAGPGQTGPVQTGMAATSVSQTAVRPAPPVSQTSARPATSSFAIPPSEDIGSTMVAAIMPEGSLDGGLVPEEAAPRRPAPDLTANLSAMRELANSAANAALSQHVHNTNRSRVNRKLLGAGLTLGGSAVLAYFSWEAGSMPGMVGAAAGCSIAVYWTLAAALGFMQLKPGSQQAAAEVK